MPIKPCWPIPSGLLTGVFVGRMLADFFRCRCVMSINELNSFKDISNECADFIGGVNKAGIMVDEIWIDKDNVNVIQNNIVKMVDSRLIKVMPKRVLSCDCGRVFIEESHANNYCKLINIKNGAFHCKVCGGMCKSDESEQLVFCIPENVEPIKVFPAFLSKEVDLALQSLKGRKQIISRDRDTGCTIVINNRNYNIDIDFAWAQLFNSFPEKKQFLIASNHQIYTSAMVGTIAHLISDKDITFILSPYIKKETIFENMDIINGQYYRNALFLLSCLKWKKKECIWDAEIWKKYRKYSIEELDKCYRNILDESDNLESLLFYNFQYKQVNDRLGRI